MIHHSSTMAPKSKRPSDFITDTTSALAIYEQDKFSRSSASARLAFERTWLEYHHKAVAKTPGIGSPTVFPLVPDMIKIIAALMKMDGFRSFPNYLSWAKCEHIRRGHDWTLQLDLEAKQGSRSVARGLGQSKQAASFDITAVAHADRTSPVRTSGWPVFPADVAVLGAFWVLREIEIAWSARGDVHCSEDNATVSWYLPVSKTDPKAKACFRSWGCLCSKLSEALCPYHRMKDYLARLDNFLGKNADDNFDAKPLFPDYKGAVAKKVGVVSGLEGVLSRLGVQVRDVQGRRRFGGHSMRVTGSRFWATQGLEVYKIQIFARWGSATVLRYVADAPIANLTGELTGSSGSLIENHSPSIAPVLARHIRYAEEQLEALRRDIARMDRALAPSFVQNIDTKAWHHVLCGGIQVPVSGWRTLCGWPFGHAHYTMSPDAPAAGARFCGTCLRMRAPDDVQVPSGESSSTDSA